MKTLVEKTGERIGQIRDGLKLSLVRFGDQIGMGKSAVHQYEHGLTTPTLETLVKISELGNVTLDWLITGKDPATPGHGLTNETVPDYDRRLDQETVTTVMALIDQIEDFLGEKLVAQKKAKIFTALYADKIAGKPIRITDFGDLLKEQG
jgi:transcriptional regulator with XRE-family HTH domain